MTDQNDRRATESGAFDQIIEGVADLLQSAADWVRQEAGDIVREKIVLPLQRLGITVASASAAGCLVVLGITAISIAAFLYLAQWLTYPGALLAIGAVLLLGAAVFLIIKARSMQR